MSQVLLDRDVASKAIYLYVSCTLMRHSLAALAWELGADFSFSSIQFTNTNIFIGIGRKIGSWGVYTNHEEIHSVSSKNSKGERALRTLAGRGETLGVPRRKGKASPSAKEKEAKKWTP